MWSSLTSYSPPRSTLHQMIYWVHINLLSLLVLCVLFQFSFHTSHLHLICIPYFYIYFLLLCHTPSENISHGRRASTSPYLSTPSFPVRAPPPQLAPFLHMYLFAQSFPSFKWLASPIGALHFTHAISILHHLSYIFHFSFYQYGQTTSRYLLPLIPLLQSLLHLHKFPYITLKEFSQASFCHPFSWCVSM